MKITQPMSRVKYILHSSFYILHFIILHLITFFKIWYFAQLALTLQGFWCIPTEKCHERILLSVQKTDNKE